MNNKFAIKVLIKISLLVFFLTFSSNTFSQGNWTLTWSDEFNGASWTGIDTAKWSFDIGYGSNGWGNNELEYYTSYRRNSYLNGKGSLVIKVYPKNYSKRFQCWYGNCQYTSARLKTQSTFSQQHGRFEARMKLPYGQGIWPAFWMLGNNINQVGWPACGEIDVMENIGREPSTVHGTIHGPGYSGANGIGAAYTLPNGQRFSDDFHVFAVEWEQNAIRWYVDGNLYQTKTPANLPQGTQWVFNQPFFIIMNVAVGGFWPGSPDATSVFPQVMIVDYIRIYQQSASIEKTTSKPSKRLTKKS